jgi:hypothetical protein
MEDNNTENIKKSVGTVRVVSPKGKNLNAFKMKALEKKKEIKLNKRKDLKQKPKKATATLEDTKSPGR